MSISILKSSPGATLSLEKWISYLTGLSVKENTREIDVINNNMKAIYNIIIKI